jgi:hypothetical protein
MVLHLSQKDCGSFSYEKKGYNVKVDTTVIKIKKECYKIKK